MIDSVNLSNDYDVMLVVSQEARVSIPNERMTMCLSLTKASKPCLLKNEIEYNEQYANIWNIPLRRVKWYSIHPCLSIYNKANLNLCLLVLLKRNLSAASITGIEHDSLHSYLVFRYSSIL